MKFLKSEKVFLGLFAANAQQSTVSVIEYWIKAVEEIKCLSKLHHDECLKELINFRRKAKKIYEDYVIKNRIRRNHHR